MALAQVIQPHTTVNKTVKTATSPSRIDMLEILYRIVIATMGIKEAKLMAVKITILAIPSSE